MRIHIYTSRNKRRETAEDEIFTRVNPRDYTRTRVYIPKVKLSPVHLIMQVEIVSAIYALEYIAVHRL